MVLPLTTGFWDATLKGDAHARAWLNGEGAQSLLEPKDLWEINRKALE